MEFGKKELQQQGLFANIKYSFFETFLVEF